MLTEMSIYKLNSPNSPKTNNNNPTDTVPTVISNTPVTGTPSLVSGIAARIDGVGVGEATVAVVLAFTLGDGDTLAFTLGDGEGDTLAFTLGDGEGDTLAAGDGEVVLVLGA